MIIGNIELLLWAGRVVSVQSASITTRCEFTAAITVMPYAAINTTS
jgi:hypothetical protein